MARKSRHPKQEQATPEQKHKYIAGAYVRISESAFDSIHNQESIIMDFLSSHADIVLHKTYIDDGVSSFSTSRPGLEAMLRDARYRVINCIIVKDLSRLGRSYIETGELVLNVFPELNIRFISITSNIDSTNKNSTSSIRMSLQNVMNFTYSYDISKKVKASIRFMQQNGTYIAAKIPYGYRKKTDGGKTVYVEDEAYANTVRSIFSLASKGRSAFEIAGYLNEQNIPSPSRSGTTTLKNSPLWTRKTIMDILQNQFYIGALIMGKTRTPDRHMRHPQRIPPDKWDIFEDHHNPIISKEQFEQVQEILNLRRKTCTKADSYRQQHDDTYIGAALYCGFCGRKMKKRTWLGKPYFICPRYMESASGCTINSISADALKDDILDAIHLRTEGALHHQEKQRKFESTDLFCKYRDTLTLRLQDIQKQYFATTDLRSSMYEKVCSGVYTISDYRAFSSSLEERLTMMMTDIGSIKRKIKGYDDYLSANSIATRLLLKFGQEDTLSKKAYVHFIERISVQSGQVNIQWKILDPSTLNEDTY